MQGLYNQVCYDYRPNRSTVHSLYSLRCLQLICNVCMAAGVCNGES